MKYLIITALGALLAINVASQVAPSVQQLFGDINAALQYANHATRAAQR